MSPAVSSCPACAAPLEFKTRSAIVICCEHCHSVVARSDVELATIGKVAELAETATPLTLGLRGSYAGVAFELVGRAQIEHASEAIWNEWYAHFDDDRWGWLAEAQGRFYLTFERAAGESDRRVPAFEIVSAGSELFIGPVRWVVQEVGSATIRAASGELPYLLQPGVLYRYADLVGANEAFATIDYGDTLPDFYAGREVTLAQLGLQNAADARAVATIAAVDLGCPQCGGALALRAPDLTQRVGCPYCGASLDATRGKLSFLSVLQPPKTKPSLPLGSVGRVAGQPYTVLGCLVRSVTSDGTRYPWLEYLLHAGGIGFRWLIENNGHWSFVTPISAADVTFSNGIPVYQGHPFRLFTSGTPIVEELQGEFPWRVRVGDQVDGADYVAPPQLLSRETSRSIHPQTGAEVREVNWSLGQYMTAGEVQRAFGLANELPQPVDVGSHQPFRHRDLYATWLKLSLAALIVAIAVGLLSRSREVTRQQIPLLAGQAEQELLLEELTIEPHKNLRIDASVGSLTNSWVYVAGEFVAPQSGAGGQFGIGLERWEGYDEGERWVEGSLHDSAILSALPQGRYALRLSLEKPPELAGQTVEVRVRQGVMRWSSLGLLLAALAVVPLGVAVMHLRFERARWIQSDNPPSWAQSE